MIATLDEEQPRLFWVVEGTSSWDTEDQNEEIFATRDEADIYAQVFGKKRPYRIYIGEVRNYYQEDNGSWNYDDQSDTFTPIITITVQTDTEEVAA